MTLDSDSLAQFGFEFLRSLGEQAVEAGLHLNVTPEEEPAPARSAPRRARPSRWEPPPFLDPEEQRVRRAPEDRWADAFGEIAARLDRLEANAVRRTRDRRDVGPPSSRRPERTPVSPRPSPATTELVNTPAVQSEESEANHLGTPTPLGGTEVAAKLLNGVPKADGQLILDKMDSRDPEIAADIRKMMLTFNDLETIDQRGFQALLREIPTEDLVIALKTASDEMKDKVFSNVSSRAADQIREESDLLPPMRLSEIEQVQRQIVDVARRLEEEGVLSIDTGGGGDDVLV